MITPATTTDILLRHVRVNSIADYYDIPQLKELANTKIQHLLESTWHASGFSAVVREAFKSTSDAALHEIMALTAAAHIEDIVELEEFVNLEVMGSFAATILRNTIAANRAKENTATQELQAVKSELKSIESRLQSSEQDCTFEKSMRETEAARVTRTMENLDNCFDVLSKTDICRNPRCEAEFKCYIERGGNLYEPRYTLRCSRCNCRHK